MVGLVFDSGMLHQLIYQWLLSFRGFSTFHALVVAIASLYLFLFSDLFDEDSHKELIINRRSTLSDAILGISIGYFLSDSVMMFWHFPALGGMEFILHHGLSIFSIFLSLVSRQGQVYIIMVLFTECTTPFVNLRWYLDVAGEKNSKLYICNGAALFVGWLVGRILLFTFFFYHIIAHFDQVKDVFLLGFYSLIAVPPVLAMMNLFWFWKIARGMMKTLSKAGYCKQSPPYGPLFIWIQECHRTVVNFNRKIVNERNAWRFEIISTMKML
ncbi:hypothetical protein ACSBR1_002136 [Camellia fascicularis]